MSLTFPSRVVVNNLDVLGSGRSPDEAEAVLVVDPDAVLTGAITFEQLEPITGRNPQVVEPAGDLELPELATRDGFEGDKMPDARAASQSLGV
jgi:hypothetical protein